MKCAKVRDLAVLIPSDDLPSADAPRVARHLESCPACREFATAAPLPLSALKTSSPLRDSDYAAIRARVIGDLRPARRPFVFVRAAWLASAAALIVILLAVTKANQPVTVSPIAHPSTVVETPRQIAAPAPLPSLIAEVAESVPIEEPAESSSAVSSDPIVRAPRPAAARPHPPLRSHTTLAELEKPSELRIQMQTGDPDVRIIWIVNPTLELDLEPLEEES